MILAMNLLVVSWLMSIKKLSNIASGISSRRAIGVDSDFRQSVGVVFLINFQ